MDRVAIFLMCVLGLLAAPAAVVLSAPVTEGQVMLIVAPPWQNAQDIILRAKADSVGPKTAPFAAFAASDTPGLEARLKHAGAWAVLDGQIISQLCGA
ncbi:hypothetical protein [Falsihalocynthiibacter arcticus]|uniref:Uncharacterized protein n=1 Tax=Falsihalocynthiibacter arcticus TaxID=1579316 RepID=A0A126UZW1_9RHOB|nr:hypothetical protein [Falsihalocynthiibacter arcticus]AML51612.1 hypothetical protein RC74_10360 [Falsihalocynthiibacter arcticus]